MPTTALNLSLDPSSTTFGYKDLPISVGTNNETGFTMTVSTANDNTNLVNTADSNTVIETLPPSSPTTTGYTDADFIVNKWGYKNGLSNNYFPFQSGATVLENDTQTNEKSTTLRFATKIDYMQPEGTYSTTFNFSLVANPVVQYIQNLNPSLCTTTPLTVVDSRDDQEYIVQRLTDGNCWMMTNLNLGITDLATDLTPGNTNIVTTVPAATFNGWRKTAGTATYTAGEFISILGTDPVSQTPYGTLYNYYATSAGTISGSSVSTNSPYDICPAGWRLPIGGPNGKGEFQTLYEQPEYNTIAKLRAPIADGGAAFALTGYFQNGAPEYKDGNYAHYWSSTRVNNTEYYDLWLGTSSSHFSTTNPNVRTYGFTIRCILKDASRLKAISNMQDVTPDIVKNIANGSTATLKDSRDNKEYTVAKINEELWMTQNLTFEGGTLDPATSDVTVPRDLNGSSVKAFYDLKNDAASSSTHCYGTDSGTGNGYTNACMYYTPSDVNIGGAPNAWYNYAGATAGTIVSGTAEATESICPKGWTLPTNIQGMTLASVITASITPFNSIYGGYLYNGTPWYETTYGSWWTTTANGATSRRRFYYNNGAITGNSSYYRYSGYYVRCIARKS